MEKNLTKNPCFSSFLVDAAPEPTKRADHNSQEQISFSNSQQPGEMQVCPKTVWGPFTNMDPFRAFKYSWGPYRSCISIAIGIEGSEGNEGQKDSSLGLCGSYTVENPFPPIQIGTNLWGLSACYEKMPWLWIYQGQTKRDTVVLYSLPKPARVANKNIVIQFWWFVSIKNSHAMPIIFLYLA